MKESSFIIVIPVNDRDFFCFLDYDTPLVKTQAAAMLQPTASKEDERIEIQGHTYYVGIAKANQVLSEARANTVRPV